LLAGQNDTTFHLINIIPLEEYLASVISSEMAASAPLEFLKAQAVTARSWLMAMLAKKNPSGYAIKEQKMKSSSGRM